MQSVALSWLVLILTDSSFYLGLVSALQTLPILIFSFLAAWWRTRPASTGSSISPRGHDGGGLVLGFLVASDLVNIWLLFLLVFLAAALWPLTFLFARPLSSTWWGRPICPTPLP